MMPELLIVFGPALLVILAVRGLRRHQLRVLERAIVEAACEQYRWRKEPHLAHLLPEPTYKVHQAAERYVRALEVS